MIKNLFINFLSSTIKSKLQFFKCFETFFGKISYLKLANAGLRPAARNHGIQFVGVPRLFCRYTTDTDRSKIQVIAPATSNGKNGRVLYYKTFSVRKSRISSRNPDFSGIFLHYVTQVMSGFRKTLTAKQ